MIRVFVGTESKTEIARKVLQHSILRHTSAEVQFVPMIGPEWEYPLDGIKVGTGFSLRRWMIPSRCEFEGRAIYLDADQLVFSDIRGLWNKPEEQPRPDCSMWCTFQPDKYSKAPWPQTSVMVIDCKAAEYERGFDLREILAYLRSRPNDREAYADLMHGMTALPGDNGRWHANPPVQIDTAWNDLNVYRHGKTKLLHYTKEPEQPWYVPTHPQAKHWKVAFAEAFKAGCFTRDEVEAAVGNFGKKEDWRPTNGLHPSYLELLKG